MEGSDFISLAAVVAPADHTVTIHMYTSIAYVPFQAVFSAKGGSESDLWIWILGELWETNSFFSRRFRKCLFRKGRNLESGEILCGSENWDGRGSVFDVRSRLFHDTGGVYPVPDSKTDSPKDCGAQPNCGGRSGAFRRKRIRTQHRISHSWRNHLRRACGNLLSGEKEKVNF